MNFAIILVALLASVPGCLSAQETAPYPTPPANVSSSVTLASETEPGDRLVITGRAYNLDGKSPLAGLILYLYQTDASGVYNKTDRSWQRPRIRGWVKTDQEGKYEIRTIKPGSYPGSRNPAHIHVIIKLPEKQATWIDDFLFDGDPFLGEDDYRKSASKGAFSYIVKTVKDEAGILRSQRNIRIE